MAVRGKDIASVIKQQIEDFDAQVNVVDVGTVVEIGDGIAQVHGLSGVAFNELVEFEDGTSGIALNLEEDSVGVVILGNTQSIKEGSEVRSTSRIAEVPVGEALIGRVVDALGNPIDGKGPIKTSQTQPVEVVAPDVSMRNSVDTPVQTGIKAIDSMIPIGRGQRELIIGDRSIGKTAIATDTIINQKGGDVIFNIPGSKSFESSLRSLAIGGKLILLGEISTYKPEFPISEALFRSASIQAVLGASKCDIENALTTFLDHNLHPEIDSIHSLNDWERGFNLMKTRNSIGRILFTP